MMGIMKITGRLWGIMGDYMGLLAEFCLKLIPPTVGVGY
jgi:hypothetical protein